jgi:NADPH:quinone reductase-like Zn-dependent oxidoreductase
MIVMKAVVMLEYGSADVLKVRDIEEPRIKDNEILVRVVGSSVNPVDCKVRKGDVKLFSGVKVPRRLGSDYAGVVEGVGHNVRSVEVGDEVYGMVKAFTGDAYAELITVTEDEIALKPKDLSFTEAAVLPLVGLTVHQLFYDVVSVSSGSKVLVNGCSGGLGHIAVQMAKHLGCNVTGVCSASNAEYAKSIGANKVIDYRKENIYESEDQYDLFFDAVANSSYKKAKSSLKKDGVYVSSIPSFENMILAPMLNIVKSKKQKYLWVSPNARSLKALGDLVESAGIRPTIDKIYSIDDVVDAHLYSETGRVVGKVALKVG